VSLSSHLTCNCHLMYEVSGRVGEEAWVMGHAFCLVHDARNNKGLSSKRSTQDSLCSLLSTHDRSCLHPRLMDHHCSYRCSTPSLCGVHCIAVCVVMSMPLSHDCLCTLKTLTLLILLLLGTTMHICTHTHTFTHVLTQQSEGELDLREQYLQRLRELVTLQLRCD